MFIPYGDHLLRQYNKEHMLMITLNDKDEPVNEYILGIGDKHTCVFRLSDIFKNLESSQTDRFILAHNHVVGRIDQSEEDDNVTEIVMTNSIQKGYTFVDHIIVKNTRPDLYFSYKEHDFQMTADNELSNSLPDED